MARVENIREMTHGSGIIRRNLQRTFERLLGAIEIVRIADLARFTDQRLAQSIIGLRVARITPQQLLIIGDLIVGPRSLGKRVRAEDIKGQDRNDDRYYVLPSFHARSPVEESRRGFEPPSVKPLLITKVGALLATVQVPAISTVVWRRQIWKHFVNAVCSQIRPLRPLAKVDAVTGSRCDIVLSAHNANRNVGDVVVGASAIGKSCRIAGETAETFLVFRLRRGDLHIEAQKLRARTAAIIAG